MNMLEYFTVDNMVEAKRNIKIVGGGSKSRLTLDIPMIDVKES